MVLTLYKTDIRPEMNAVIEDFDKYILDEDRIAHQWMDVKYIQPEIDIMVKVPLDGHYNSLKQFDYACLYDPDTKRDYYYFVVHYKWKAKMTLQLQLSMDTLNTFWDDIKTSMTANSRVTRRYFDRWKVDVDNIQLVPIVDKHPEDILTPPLVRVGAPKVMGESDHWTIVYLTEYDKTDALSENPTTCLALPDTEKYMTGDILRTLNYDAFPDKTICVLDHEHSPNAVIQWDGGRYSLDGASALAMFEFQHSTKKVALKIYVSGGWTVHSVGSATVNGTDVVYRQPSNFTLEVISQYWQFDDPVNFTGSVLMPFPDWFASRKTDPRLIKIMELPYAPFKVGYADGKMNVPHGWQMRPDGALMLVDPTPNFVSIVEAADDPVLFEYPRGTDPSDQTPANPLAYETKLLNSAYRTVKYIYDGNAHAVKLENYQTPAGSLPDYSVRIAFQASTGMDGSSVFSFKSGERMETDYGEYMVCNRSTEIPYYTNEYLNYLRYGKAVDEKNANLRNWSTAVSGIGSAASTGASMLFAVGQAFKGGLTAGIVGAAIGGAIGLVSTGIATAYSINQGKQQIDAKIDQYTHQASSVSAASDLSVFRTYGKNKLLKVEYEPEEELRKSIGRYFELFGYSCDEYGIPNWNTRIWSDYFVIEPQFVSDFAFGAYEADIASRMKSGFRIMHRRENSTKHYDMLCQYENWERSVLE